MFREWLPGVPPKQTEISWNEIAPAAVLRGCSNVDTWIIALGSMSNTNIYGRFRCSKMVEKHCIRVLLNCANC